jgi:hypothetical protein
MALTEGALRELAVRRYELGRLRHSLQGSWPVVPVIAIGTLQGSNPLFIVSTGAMLLGLATAFSWRGQALGRAVWPGLLAGTPPLLVPRLASPHSLCWIGGTCWSYCALLCPLSGLIAGLALAMLAARHRERGFHFLTGAAVIAAITGAFGCSVAGALGILGMLGGGFLGLIPIHLRHQPE